jgi:hypothetical protein
MPDLNSDFDLSPNFPPVRSRVLGCRHAHRDGVSRFGRVPFLRPGRVGACVDIPLIAARYLLGAAIASLLRARGGSVQSLMLDVQVSVTEGLAVGILILAKPQTTGMLSVNRYRSGIPPLSDLNALIQQTKFRSGWGPNQRRSGPPLYVNFQSYFSKLVPLQAGAPLRRRYAACYTITSRPHRHRQCVAVPLARRAMVVMAQGLTFQFRRRSEGA